jgi:hypothetical protein
LLTCKPRIPAHGHINIRHADRVTDLADHTARMDITVEV